MRLQAPSTSYTASSLVFLSLALSLVSRPISFSFSYSPHLLPSTTTIARPPPPLLPPCHPHSHPPPPPPPLSAACSLGTGKSSDAGFWLAWLSFTEWSGTSPPRSVPMEEGFRATADLIVLDWLLEFRCRSHGNGTENVFNTASYMYLLRNILEYLKRHFAGNRSLFFTWKCI